ncbi:hypothetical protein LTR66_012595 [Elasticomyces elasticus]|nr:hypothetical protein LTR66_012595 [Elasticomyces elasticus]
MAPIIDQNSDLCLRCPARTDSTESKHDLEHCSLVSPIKINARWPKFDLGDNIKDPDERLRYQSQAGAILEAAKLGHDTYDGTALTKKLLELAFQAWRAQLEAKRKAEPPKKAESRQQVPPPTLESPVSTSGQNAPAASSSAHAHPSAVTAPSGSAQTSGPNAGQSIDTTSLEQQFRQVTLSTDSQFASRPGWTTQESQDTKQKVFTNHFQVTLQPSRCLYEYTIGDFDEEDTRQQKRKLIERLIAAVPLLHNHQRFFASDYVSRIIAIKDLSLLEDPTRVPLPEASLLVQGTVTQYQTGTKDSGRQKTLNVYYNRRLSFDNLRPDASRTNPHPFALDTANALQILIAKCSAAVPGTVQLGKNRFYPPGPVGALLEGLQAQRGFYSSVHSAAAGALININSVASVFYQPTTLNRLMDDVWSREGSYERLQDAIRGLRVRICYNRCKLGEADRSKDTDARRTKTVAELAPGNKTPTQLKFMKTLRGSQKQPSVSSGFKDGVKREISVAENISIEGYLNGGKLTDEDNPCVNLGGASEGTKSWFPPEQLEIIQNQPFKRVLSPEVIGKLVTFACRGPNDNKRSIDNYVRDVVNHAPQILADSGVRISTEMLRVPFRIIPAPQLLYGPGPSVSAIHQAHWDLKSRKFLDTRRAVGNIHIIWPPGPGVLSSQKKLQYIQRMQQEFHKYGLQLPSASWTSNSERAWSDQQALSKAYLEREMNLAKQAGARLVIMFLKNNTGFNPYHYAAFKYTADLVVGIQSLCINEGKYSTQIVGPGYLANVAMKVNLKFCNTNHSVKYSSPKLLNEDNKIDTLILGADATHPSPGSSGWYPSTTAVVGSVDDRFGRFPGSIHFQSPGQEIIGEMRSMVEQRIREWQSCNDGRLPAKILYYRDGVGTSQYNEVLNNEAQAIYKAYDIVQSSTTAAKQGEKKKLKLTVVIVTKRHHTRFYPTPGMDVGMNGNCLPGTVVDRGVTIPHCFDFFLQAHSGIKGTVKPTYYVVLKDEIGFTARELQDFTHDLCFTYVRATSAVSYAPPTYYADRLCERGRLYLKIALGGGTNLTEDQVQKIVGRLAIKGGKVGKPYHSALDGSMFWM